MERTKIEEILALIQQARDLIPGVGNIDSFTRQEIASLLREAAEDCFSYVTENGKPPISYPKTVAGAKCQINKNEN